MAFRERLTGALPSELGRLVHLRKLSLEENDLTGSVPPELGQLANLTHLDLSRNRLTGSVPPEFGQLANLTQLWIEENELTGPLPLSLTSLPRSSFLYHSTQLYVLADAGFRAWLETIREHRGTRRDCSN